MVQFLALNVREMKATIRNATGQLLNSQNRSSRPFRSGVVGCVDVLIQIIIGRFVHASAALLGSAGESAGYAAHSAKFASQFVNNRLDFRIVFVFSVIHWVRRDVLEGLCYFWIL